MNLKNNLMLLLSLVAIWLTLFVIQANACSISGGSDCITYDLCVPGYKKVSNLTIRAQGETCYTNCDQACQTTYSTISAGNELNEDVISLCKLFCKSNLTFSVKKRLSTLKPNTYDSAYFTALADNIVTSKKFYPFISWDYSYLVTSLFNDMSPSKINFTNNGCSANDLNQAYDTTLDVKIGGRIILTMINPLVANTNNEVVLCGQDVRTIEPEYCPFDRGSGGYTGDWSGWNGYIYPWWYNVRNTFSHDPFFFMKNGDWVKISYYGRSYASWGWPDETQIADFVFRLPDNPGSTTNAHNRTCSYGTCWWASDDRNHFAYFIGKPDYYYNVNDTTAQAIGFTQTSTSGQTTTRSFYRDNTNTVTATFAYEEFTANSLQNLSNSFFRPGFLGFDRIWPSEWSDWYSDNYGCQFFRLERKGCVYNNGQRLQYAIVPKGSTPQATDWQTVPAFSGNTVTITANKKGHVFLKIAKMQPSEQRGISCSTDNATCPEQNGYFTLDDLQAQIYNNVSGQYYLNAEVNNS